MKRFACGDVIPGCGKTFEGDSSNDILVAVGAHAQDDHGIAEVDDDTIAAVLRHTHDV